MEDEKVSNILANDLHACVHFLHALFREEQKKEVSK